MAVDDFSIKSGNCPPIGNCDFENGFCAWRQDIDDDYINWQLGSGDTPGFNTGPHVDHTTNTSFGKEDKLFELSGDLVLFGLKL